MWHIYDEIGQFREGMKSLEVYIEQTKTMLGSADSSMMTMFHQMLSYLMLQEDMNAEAEKANGK